MFILNLLLAGYYWGALATTVRIMLVAQYSLSGRLRRNKLMTEAASNGPNLHVTMTLAVMKEHDSDLLVLVPELVINFESGSGHLDVMMEHNNCQPKLNLYIYR